MKATDEVGQRNTSSNETYDTTSLAALIPGNEAIISAFNPGWKNPNLYDDQVRGTASIIAAIKKAGIKMVIRVGGAGWRSDLESASSVAQIFRAG